jgi:hypothetical protein
MPNVKDYMPDRDGDFHVWFKNYCDRIIANPARYGVLPADLAALQAVYTDWLLKYPKHITDQATAQASAGDKDDARDAAELVGRRLTKLIQSQMGTTTVHREELGITVADMTRTQLSEQVVLTTPAPIIEAKCVGSKTVRIDWYPSQAPGESEAMPAGIAGVSIWVAEGGIPSDESQWRHLVLDSKSPHIHNVGNDATVTMAYKAQWFDKRKRVGRFCLPVQVAVTA